MLDRVQRKLGRISRRISANFIELPPLKSPIFIIGTARGGTTILGGCLGQHPNIFYPGYPAHFELLPEWCKLAGIDISAPETKKHTCPPLDASDVTDDIRRNVHSGFAKIMAIHWRRIG